MPAWDLLESIPDAVIVVDGDGRIEHVNHRATELFMWSAADLVGQAIEVLVPAAQRGVHTGHRAAYAANRRPRPMGAGLSLSGARRDGSEFPAEIALSPLHGTDGYVVATVRDITDRVLANQKLNEAQAKLHVLDERDRIARELHDNVIQRLFAAGLYLQASVNRADSNQRVAHVIDEIDEAIREIRGTIYTLHRAAPEQVGLESAVRSSVIESERVLGHRPTLHITGQLDGVPGDLGAEMLAVLRELLMNVVKHAEATATDVHIDAVGDTLKLCVADDGLGMAPLRPVDSGGQGLRNIHERAARLGGVATVVARNPSGTQVCWSVPRVASLD